MFSQSTSPQRTLVVGHQGSASSLMNRGQRSPSPYRRNLIPPNRSQRSPSPYRSGGIRGSEGIRYQPASSDRSRSSQPVQRSSHESTRLCPSSRPITNYGSLAPQPTLSVHTAASGGTSSCASTLSRGHKAQAGVGVHGLRPLIQVTLQSSQHMLNTILVRRRSRRRKRRPSPLPVAVVDRKDQGTKISNSGCHPNLRGGCSVLLAQSERKVVMLRVLNDIKRELAEQKRAAKEKEDTVDGQSLQHGSEYSDESLDGSIGPIEFEDRQRPVPKCTVLHYSPFKAVWDWIILLLVLYTAVFTPYIVAFLVNETETLMNLNDDQKTRLKNAGYKTTDPLVIVDLMVDLMFIADIIINFRTTFVQGGEVISNSKEIAINYLKGWFTIDAIAAIPFDLLFFGSGTSDTLTITGCLKLVRLLRLVRVIRRADQYSQYPSATLLLMLIIFALIGHWLACAFYTVAYFERKTLPLPISWLDALAVQMQTPYLANDTTSGPDIQSRYITAMYFTMTTLTSIGFGNVAPNTNGEKLFSIFAMMIGALMSAAIFGNFSSIMMRMYQGSEEMQQKTRSITDFIKFHLIPKTLSKRMHDAFLHSWSDTNGVDMNGVLKSFPEQIQADICLHLNKNLLNNNIAFKGASPGCLRALSLRFTTTHAPPGDNLIHLGDIVNCIYFIARGSIEILKDDVCMAILGRGDIFGLSVDDLTTVVKSNYSVHALTFCDMNKIEAYDLQDIFDMYPEFTENFKGKFALTFNLKRGEYTQLVEAHDWDEETLKLVKQKRPKLQCKGDDTQSSMPEGLDDELKGSIPPIVKPAMLRRSSTYEEPSTSGQHIIELTPSGHGMRKSYDPSGSSKHLHARPSRDLVPAEIQDARRTAVVPAQKAEAASTKPAADEKPTFKSIMLLAAKMQKQKDAEMEAELNAQRLSQQPSKHVAIDPKFIKDNENETTEAAEQLDRDRLQKISDKIDECLQRAQRVEQHWNTNVQKILEMLGEPADSLDVGQKSYV